MIHRHVLVLMAASLSSACAPDPVSAPAEFPASVPISEPVPAPAAVPPPAPVPVSEPAPVCPERTHPTLRAACLAFEDVDGPGGYDDPEDCGEIQSGIMPDADTRYHLLGRMWNGTRQAQLLVLESGGCFTLVGELGWTTMSEVSTEVQSTTVEIIDLDDDGKDESVFRIVELEIDASSEKIRKRTIRSARYCRATRGTWTCTEVLTRRPQAKDWPE